MSTAQVLRASAGLAIVGAVALIALPTKLSLTSRAFARESYICMTDDGYGRRRPCSADYRAANPNWRATDNCFTDDGYGRRRPCSADYKAKQQK